MNTLLYFLTVIIWGGTWIGIHYQVQSVDPLASLLYRFAMAAFVMLVLCIATRSRLRFSLKDNVFIALQGVFLFSTNFWLLYLSAQVLESGLVALLFSTIILMNIANSWLFLGQRIQLRELTGALLGIAGLGLALAPSLIHRSDPRQLQAIALCLGGAYLASLGNIVSTRNQRQGIPVISANTLGLSYACAVLLLIALSQHTVFSFDTSPSYMGSLLYLALPGTLIAFYCYLTLLGRIGPQKAAYAMLLFPIVAVAISAYIEHLPMSKNLLIGLSFVLLGNLIVMAQPAWLTRLRLSIGKIA